MSDARPLRLLVLASAPPHPLTAGGRLAIFEPLRRLAARGHSIDLLTFGGADHQALLACDEVVLIDERPLARGWVRRIRSPVRRAPYIASLYWSSALANAPRRLLASRRYDLVQVESLSMAGYAPIARRSGVPVVLRAQNVVGAGRRCCGSSASPLLCVHPFPP